MEPALEAVARAYRIIRETGAPDYPAYLAARDAYLAAQPEAAADPDLSGTVGRLIAEACNAGLVWGDVRWWRR